MRVRKYQTTKTLNHRENPRMDVNVLRIQREETIARSLTERIVEEHRLELERMSQFHEIERTKSSRQKMIEQGLITPRGQTPREQLTPRIYFPLLCMDCKGETEEKTLVSGSTGLCDYCFEVRMTKSAERNAIADGRIE